MLTLVIWGSAGWTLGSMGSGRFSSTSKVSPFGSGTLSRMMGMPMHCLSPAPVLKVTE